MIAFWHLYAVENWYDVACEQLHALARARFPGPIEAHITGSEQDAFELRLLAAAFRLGVRITQHTHNQFEYPTLAALKSHCDNTPDEDAVLYFHTKNVTGRGLTYTKWRWAMMATVIVPWQDRVADLARYDAVGFCRNEERFFAGNFWWARADWVRRLPNPVPSSDRFCFETWLFSVPGMRGLSLVSEGGDPYLPHYYPQHGNPHLRYIEFLLASSPLLSRVD